ncbi:MAG: family transporter [Solirubrobacterales bacterium]|nr:family transporter [Solirubrobacterales bacterium]
MLGMHVRGTALVVASAASFALMSILAKDASALDAGVTTILAGRFLLAAALFTALAGWRGIRLRALPVRPALIALALGGGIYATESAVYFSALTHIDASIASLVLCLYPAVVLVLAVGLRRERAGVRQVSALVLALAGALVVLSAGAGGQLDATGLLLTLSSTLLYAVYVTCADTVSGALDPLAFGGLLSVGAGSALLLSGTVTGRLHPAALADPAVATDVVLMAGVSTVLAVTAFFAGMRRIGATGASTIASVEPVFTVALAAVFLGETLSPVQALGGLVVLAGILLVQAPGHASPGGPVALGGSSPAARNAPPAVTSPDSLPWDGPPARPAPAAPARALTLEPAC